MNAYKNKFVLCFCLLLLVVLGFGVHKTGGNVGLENSKNVKFVKKNILFLGECSIKENSFAPAEQDVKVFLNDYKYTLVDMLKFIAWYHTTPTQTIACNSIALNFNVMKTTVVEKQSTNEDALNFFILGDACVGRTQLVNFWFTDKFSEDQEDKELFNMRGCLTVNVNEDKTVENNINDCSVKMGDNILKIYLKGKKNKIFLLIYDVSNKDSFEDLKNLYDRISLLIENDDNYRIFIVGNKKDLKKEGEVCVDVQEVQTWVDELNNK